MTMQEITASRHVENIVRPAKDRVQAFKDINPALLEAYFIAQEAKIDKAFAQTAERNKAFRIHGEVPTMNRLMAAMNLQGYDVPWEVHHHVATALEDVYVNDAMDNPQRLKGARLMEEVALKGAVGKMKGDIKTSLAFLANHPEVKDSLAHGNAYDSGHESRLLARIDARTGGAGSPNQGLPSDVVYHARNVVNAMMAVETLAHALKSSSDPAMQARAGSLADVAKTARTHETAGPVVVWAEKNVAVVDEKAMIRNESDLNLTRRLPTFG